MESSFIELPGFKIDWTLKDVSFIPMMYFVSKDITGDVSTPGLGSVSPPNYCKEKLDYTVVIELPHDIIDVIGDGALVVDVDIVPDSKRTIEVEFLTGEPKLEYNNISMNWSADEEFCVSKG